MLHADATDAKRSYYGACATRQRLKIKVGLVVTNDDDDDENPGLKSWGIAAALMGPGDCDH